MNLFFLAEKNNRTLAISNAVKRSVRQVGTQSWRGFEIPPSDEPQIRIRRASAWHPFRDRPETVGWYAASAKDKTAVVSLTFCAPDSLEPVFPTRQLDLNGALSPVFLPWHLAAKPHAGDFDLVIHVPSHSEGPVFLAIHHALDRKPLLELCKGRGIEIGPGPHPQVLPGPGVEVSYIEQMPPAEWNRLYNAKSKFEMNESLWEHYVVGDAHNLPVEDGSLDFIFSSHVLEHLANPLGHLEIWGRKLRKGGLVVAVVPDYIGSKDYGADASDIRELIAEYESGQFSATREQFRRYARLRGAKDDGEKIWADKFSIHVHFYTNSNMALMMQEAIRRFGFQDYSIIHTPNHKDFHLVAIR